MNVDELKPEQLLRLGIDERTVWAIQLRFMENFQSKKAVVVQGQLSETTAIDEESRSKEQCSSSNNNSPQPLPFSLDDNEIKKSIQFSVCCCAFFHGFSEIDQQSIDALTKILDGKLNKMCEQLKMLGNRLRQGKPSAEFKNPVHQVLKMHLLPVQTLFDFYRSRVLAPFELLSKQFKENKMLEENKNDEKKQQKRKRKRGKDFEK
uniref:Uncharacterized protein n=1 Tax=Meloidogyne incognita TaxID=6306 RepID=A0A914L766_MELIC